jgi:hypothetical protein
VVHSSGYRDHCRIALRAGSVRAGVDCWDRGSDMRRYLLAAVITFAGAALAHAQTPDQQERCAMNTKQIFSQTWSDYKSHYSIKTGKCFALLIRKSTDFGIIVDELLLVDVIDDPAIGDPDEGRHYAAYVQTTIPDKPEYPAPFHCYLIPIQSLREIKDCKTREEFDAFVAPYLNE